MAGPLPTSGFRRRLTYQALELLRTHPLTRSILDAVRSSDDLDLQLRGAYVDVYFAGFNVFQIKPASGKIRLGSENETQSRPHPWTSKWMALDDIQPGDIPFGIEWVKTQRANKLTGREVEFESRVVRDNRTSDSPILVLDRQIVQPGWKMRLDLLLYDTSAERLALAELKLLANPEADGRVFEQLLRYQGLLANNPWIAATYPHIYEQKVTLGLIDHDLGGVRVDQPPLLLYLLSGYEGPSTSTGKLERMRKAVTRKAKEFSTLQVHMYNWPDFQQAESCRLPSITDLPQFEQWAQSELPDS